MNHAHVLSRLVPARMPSVLPGFGLHLGVRFREVPGPLELICRYGPIAEDGLEAVPGPPLLVV